MAMTVFQNIFLSVSGIESTFINSFSFIDLCLVFIKKTPFDLLCLTVLFLLCLTVLLKGEVLCHRLL